jgi:hypothetical protein
MFRLYDRLNALATSSNASPPLTSPSLSSSLSPPPSVPAWFTLSSDSQNDENHLTDYIRSLFETDFRFYSSHKITPAKTEKKVQLSDPEETEPEVSFFDKIHVDAKTANSLLAFYRKKLPRLTEYHLKSVPIPNRTFSLLFFSSSPLYRSFSHFPPSWQRRKHRNNLDSIGLEKYVLVI